MPAAVIEIVEAANPDEAGKMTAEPATMYPNCVAAVGAVPSVIGPVKVVAPTLSEKVTPVQFVPPITSGTAVSVSIEFVFSPLAIVALPRIAVTLPAAEMSTPVVQLAPSSNFVDVLSTDGAVSACTAVVPLDTVNPDEDDRPTALSDPRNQDGSTQDDCIA